MRAQVRPPLFEILAVHLCSSARLPVGLVCITLGVLRIAYLASIFPFPGSGSDRLGLVTPLRVLQRTRIDVVYCCEARRAELCSYVVVWQVFYDSFDEDFDGRWIVSQSSDYGGIDLRYPRLDLWTVCRVPSPR